MAWRREMGWLVAIALTIMLAGLVSFAVTPGVDLFSLTYWGIIGASVAFFAYLFPGSRFFNLAYANGLAVYTCAYVFFVESNFVMIESTWILRLGFLAPPLSFLAGTLIWREQVRAILTREHYTRQHYAPLVFRWLLPVLTVGVVTFLLPTHTYTQATAEWVFAGGVLIVVAVTLWVSQDIAAFMLDTGLAFEGLFETLAEAFLPLYAFLVFYSTVVIVFGALYRVIDVHSATVHFLVDGAPYKLTFMDGLYFSLITMSTVGYGHIVPESPEIRGLVSVQIIIGVVLLLFGFAELMRFAREKPRHRGHPERHGD